MDAISLWQPWAQFVVIGEKEFETRGRPTSKRGRIAIHAAKKQVTAQIPPEFTAPTFSYLQERGMWFAFGAIIGTVEIVECRNSESFTFSGTKRDITEKELALGDFSPGRWAWRLANPVMFAKPIPFKGMQGFFRVPDDVLREEMERA